MKDREWIHPPRPRSHIDNPRAQVVISWVRFLEKSHSLRGENTQKVYQLGDRVEVQVVRVDMERRQIDLGLVEILETVRADERRRGPSHSKAKPKREQRSPVKRRKQRPGRRERQKGGRGRR